MKEFVQLIQQDDVTVMDLIKGSMRTIRDDKGKYAFETFKYIAFTLATFVGLFFLILFLTAATSSAIVLDIGLFFISMLVYIFLISAFIGVYYPIMYGSQRTVDGYAKKGAKLYVFVYLVSLVFGFAYTFFLSLVASLSTGGVFYGIVAFVFAIILFLCGMAFGIIAIAVMMEYVLTQKTIMESVTKVLNVFGKNVGDLFKKIIGMILIQIVFFVIMFVILYFTIILTSNAASSMIGTGVVDYSTGGATFNSLFARLMFGLVVIMFVLLSIYVGWIYMTSILGYYLNLNYHENGIVGFDDDMEEQPHNVQEVSAVNSQSVDVVKVEDVQEVEPTEEVQQVEEVEEVEQVQEVEPTEEIEQVQEVEPTEQVESTTEEVQQVETTEQVENVEQNEKI